MKIFGRIIVVMIFILGVQATSFAGTREYCKIAGKKVAVANLELTTDYNVKGNTSTAELYYTFYLDQRDLNMSLKSMERYFNSKNSYKVMAAIQLKYIQDEFKKYPCVGKRKCVKNIRVSVKGFFSFLNAHKDLKTKYLQSSISKALFTSRYKNIDYFMFERAREVGYALYGISYMNTDNIGVWTVLDKMIYAMRTDGNSYNKSF